MRLALVQTDVAFGDPRRNVAAVAGHLRRLANHPGGGVDLAVFPECALTGYAARSREEAEAIALPFFPDEGVFAELAAACRATGVGAAVGFAERDGDRLFNSVATILPAPDAPIRRYRKTHLPELGFDRYATPGDAIAPFETPWGSLGILICFDIRAPEPTRLLALAGADLVLLPTNWPEGAEIVAERYPPVRADENRVWFAACNRVGSENGFAFVGGSSIADPSGVVVARAGRGEETLVADLDLASARQKRRVVRPGVHETEVFASRRPELYGDLIKRAPTPGETAP